MNTTLLIDALRAEGRRLADATARLSLEADIPTCPGWKVRDPLRHFGRIHGWAGIHILQARPTLVEVNDVVEIFCAWPTDDELVGWYRAEHAILVESLVPADPDLA